MALVDSRTIGGRLALARGEARKGYSRGVTQAQLAEAIGVHRVTVSEWERDPQVDLGSKHLIAICNFLNIESSWLLTGQGPMRPTPTEGKTYSQVIDERLGAIRGALGLVLPAGLEDTTRLDEFASATDLVAAVGRCLFYLDEAKGRTSRGGYSDLVNAINAAHGFSSIDRDFSRYLLERLQEIAAIMDETGGLWQDWENGDLELACDNQDTAGMDDILALPAPPEYQLVPRFTPTEEKALRRV